jgi:hypothetical protein
MASGQPDERADKSKFIITGIVVIGLIILGYTFFTSGAAGLNAVLKKFLMYAVIAVVIGLIVWVVIKIFSKPRVDLVEDIKKDIIEAGMMSKPPMVKDLYFTGDKDHGEFRLGTIVGYCQIQSYKDLDVLAGLTKTQIQEMEDRGEVPSQYIIKEDCFIFKRWPFPFSIFEEPKVLRTLEDEHSQLIGDVKIYSVSVIKKYGMFWPNRSYLDVVRIDIAVIREAWRGGIHQFLRDMVAINQRAVGLDSEHQKGIDNRKLLKIPSPFGEDASKRGDDDRR